MSKACLIILMLLMVSFSVNAQDSTTPTPIPETIIYRVQLNDTLGAIAARYRTSVGALMRLNDLDNAELIVIGQPLRIPVSPTPQPDAPASETVATPPPTETTAPLPMSDILPVVPTFDYGVEAFFDNHDAATVTSQITALGMHWTKLRVSWRTLEPTPGSIDFTSLDAIIDALKASNLNVLLTVSAAPDWARSTTAESGPPDNFDDYAAFMGALASRYASRVNAYEIWHEPNLRREWNSTLYPVSAEQYAELLRRAYVAIKAADPAATVVSAGLAPTGFNDGINALDDRQFLAQLYDLGLAQISDAVGAHPFGFANPPDALCCVASPGVITHFEHPSFYFADMLNDYRRIMLDNADANRFLWVTDFGWGTSEDLSAPPENSSFIGDNTLAEQAQYLARAFELGVNSGFVAVMIAYNLNSCTAQPSNTDACYYSLLAPSGAPRPAYNLLGIIFAPAVGS